MVILLLPFKHLLKLLFLFEFTVKKKYNRIFFDDSTVSEEIYPVFISSDTFCILFEFKFCFYPSCLFVKCLCSKSLSNIFLLLPFGHPLQLFRFYVKCFSDLLLLCLQNFNCFSNLLVPCAFCWSFWLNFLSMLIYSSKDVFFYFLVTFTPFVINNGSLST